MPVRLACSSIQVSAARAAGSSARTVAVSPVHRSYSSRTMRKSGVASQLP
ncbi:hypothetical protein ACFQX7_14900 [Luedemannella flava]